VCLPDLMGRRVLVTAALKPPNRGVLTPQGAVRLTRAHHGSKGVMAQVEGDIVCFAPEADLRPRALSGHRRPVDLEWFIERLGGILGPMKGAQ
jgi:hypothetical protein